MSFALVKVFLSVTKQESFSDMWSINATVENAGEDINVTKNTDDKGRLTWGGRLHFWTGPTEVGGSIIHSCVYSINRRTHTRGTYYNGGKR